MSLAGLGVSQPCASIAVLAMQKPELISSCWLPENQQRVSEEALHCN
jgi:hypothetical protein